MPNPVVQRSPGKTVIQISDWIVDSGGERGDVMQIYISDWIVELREGMLCKYIFLTG